MAAIAGRVKPTFGLREFVLAYPRMAVRPDDSGGVRLEGHFDFRATAEGSNAELTDHFALEISVPWSFPHELPTVYELERRIPRSGEYHVNPDGSLCLGSRLRLLREVAATPTLNGFARACLVPYLYAVSAKLNGGGDFPFGELRHGSVGELEDAARLLGLQSAEQAKIALRYLGMKKRRANKLECPCGCGRRLGACKFNRRLASFRRLASRSWFRAIYVDSIQ